MPRALKARSPADVIGNAVHGMRIATGETEGVRIKWRLFLPRRILNR